MKKVTPTTFVLLILMNPDTDLTYPPWNNSGIPWQTLYYQDNYPRLQQVKQKWDPNNVFHHALSISL